MTVIMYQSQEHGQQGQRIDTRTREENLKVGSCEFSIWGKLSS